MLAMGNACVQGTCLGPGCGCGCGSGCGYGSGLSPGSGSGSGEGPPVSGVLSAASWALGAEERQGVVGEGACRRFGVGRRHPRARLAEGGFLYEGDGGQRHPGRPGGPPAAPSAPHRLPPLRSHSQAAGRSLHGYLGKRAKVRLPAPHQPRPPCEPPVLHEPSRPRPGFAQALQQRPLQRRTLPRFHYSYFNTFYHHSYTTMCLTEKYDSHTKLVIAQR